MCIYVLRREKVGLEKLWGNVELLFAFSRFRNAFAEIFIRLYLFFWNLGARN